MNNNISSLKGIFPPIPTPMDNKGDVHHQALTENLQRWHQYDLAGYVVLGSNGEAAYLTNDEKAHILKTARAAMPSNKILIAGTGCESTRETIALTEQAARIGADVALVVTPHYYGGKMTDDALITHFTAIADASPIPILLYSVPKFTHVDIKAETIARCAQHPNIIGVKDSGGNIGKLAYTISLVAPDFQVLAGSASFFLAGLTLGATGGILALANVAPRQCIDIQHLYEAGKLDQAAVLQRRMLPVNTAITARFGIAGLKSALDMLGFYGGPVRPPLLDLTEQDRATLHSILEAGEVL